VRTVNGSATNTSATKIPAGVKATLMPNGEKSAPIH
jgi:hypothetical protein